MPQPARPLKNVQCLNATFTLGGKTRLFDGNGLYLELMPSGSKIWRHKYRRPNGSENRLSYGPYPQVSIVDARTKREQTRALLREGKDPALERDSSAALIQSSIENTFEKVATDWFKNFKSGWCDRHAENILSRLKSDIFPQIGHLPISSIDSPTILAAIRKIESRGAHDIAKRVTQYCAQIFGYAIGEGRGVTINPALGLTKLLKPYQKGHFKRIEISEMPEFLHALETENTHLTALTFIATKLLMLTLVRTASLIEAKWDQFDLDNRQWTIPPENMKVKDRPPFVVPLSRQAIILFQTLKSNGTGKGYIFPHNSRHDGHMSNNTILSAIKRIGFKDKMTGHGFRSLGVDTLHAVLGHSKDLTDKCLAHEEKNKVTGAYFRDPLLEQRRILMQDWADFVDFCNAIGQSEANIRDYPKVEKLIREYAQNERAPLRLVKA